MCDSTQWLQWLIATTGEKSTRGIARRVGVSHTTVQRWALTGVPPQRAWELTVRFRGDPIATLVILGRVAPDEVSHLNFGAIVRYAPAQALTKELHARTEQVLTARPEIDPRKTEVGGEFSRS